MKIALTRKNRYNNTTPSYESPTAKKTSNTRPHLQFKISPLDGAQYANISSNIKQTTKNNNASTIKKKRKHNTPIIIKKRIQTNQVKTIIILIFTSKQTKHDQVAQLARQKEQRKP
jgi:hypothetical protein